MFWLRACPRCRGDLYLEKNELGDSEVHCLNCGLRRFSRPDTSGELKSGLPVESRAAAKQNRGRRLGMALPAGSESTRE